MVRGAERLAPCTVLTALTLTPALIFPGLIAPVDAFSTPLPGLQHCRRSLPPHVLHSTWRRGSGGDERSPRPIARRKTPLQTQDDAEARVEVAVLAWLQAPGLHFRAALDKFGLLAVGVLGGAGLSHLPSLDTHTSTSTTVSTTVSISSPSEDGALEPVKLFERVLHQIGTRYVEPVDDKRLFQAAMDSMLSSLDPYTEFESEQRAKDMAESTSGHYAGVGVVIANSKLPPPPTAAPLKAPQQKVAVPGVSSTAPTPLPTSAPAAAVNAIGVVSVMEGYAYDAGLRVGDRLLSVDGVAVTGRTTTQVRDLLRGQPDTQVKVLVDRPGIDTAGQPLELTLTRQLVHMPDVKLSTVLDDRIGYVQLQGFSANAAEDVRRALLQLQKDAALKGLILDLRGNPGGLVSAAVDIASMLLPSDSPIVATMGRGSPFRAYYSTSEYPSLRDAASIPLAVLVNGNTASAAEIVSGAIQDLDVGVIVGADHTFGKGLVQSIETMPYNTALKYTTAKYYTPSGRCIQRLKYTPKQNSRETGVQSTETAEKERQYFRTMHGRLVKDAAGIEADVKVAALEPSVLEMTLLEQGAYFDYADEWAKTHKSLQTNEALSTPIVTDSVYQDFQRWVRHRVESGDLTVDLYFARQLDLIKDSITQTKYTRAKSDLEALRKKLSFEVSHEFKTQGPLIRERIRDAILARYLPESALRKLSLETDPQVKKAVETLKDRATYDQLLAAAETPSASGTTTTVSRSAEQ